MRSRFSAFALGRGEYLVRTAAATHPDLQLPREALVRELSRARERQRFMALRIFHESASASEGEVLFYARIFERGQDRSFAELSRFVRGGEAWRYVDGRLLPRNKLPDNIDALSRDEFLALYAALADV